MSPNGTTTRLTKLDTALALSRQAIQRAKDAAGTGTPEDAFTAVVERLVARLDQIDARLARIETQATDAPTVSRTR